MDENIEIQSKVLNLCERGQSLAIMSHVNPDGDGFCASLALQSIIKAQGIVAEIVVDDLKLDKYKHLIHDATITEYEPDLAYENVIVLDCNNLGRLGERRELIAKAKRVVVIDHHILENDAIPNHYQYIGTHHASVGIILFNAFRTRMDGLDPLIRKQISEQLYTTILNDTNNFTNANTNPEVFEVASCLCAWGIKPKELYQNYFQNHSPAEISFIGEVLYRAETAYHNRIFFMYSTLEMLERYGLGTESTSNMTIWAQGLKGIEVIIYMREEAEDRYRFSLRSPVLNVNQIAVTYGGGGHKNASGCTLHGVFNHVKKEILDKVIKGLASS
ncbi:MAG: DHH family phosphoesterase [Candidatus Cloacimonetes bacterium]|nr:DHH family phosphoesterase [Candidatus Cloacimonadota bacterium]